MLLTAFVLSDGCAVPWNRPPLVADLQDLCLKARLKPDVFAALASQTNALTKTNSETGQGAAVSSTSWTHRARGHAVLVAFNWRAGGEGVSTLSSCYLSDGRDQRASIDWLSEWAGTTIPRRPFTAYYLAIDHGHPKLFEVPGPGSPPPAGASGDVYALQIEDHRGSTTITLGRSSKWWPSMIRNPLTPP